MKDSLLSVRDILFALFLVLLSVYLQNMGEDFIYSSCQITPFNVHRPYKCSKEYQSLKRQFVRWLFDFNSKYEIIGVAGMMRHCSRNPIVSMSEFESIKRHFKPNSPIYQYMVESNYSGIESSLLTNEGKVEAARLGQRFHLYFRDLVSGISADQFQILCSNTSRTIETGKLFSENFLNNLPAQACNLSREVAHKIKPVGEDHYNQKREQIISLFKQNLGSETKMALDFETIEKFFAFFSIKDAIEGVPRLRKYFHKNDLKEINKFRELLRFNKVSLGNPKAIENLKKLLQMTLNNLDQIVGGKLKFSQWFTHDSAIIGFLDFIDYFKGLDELSNRPINMCSNFQLVVLRNKHNGNLRVLTLLNEEVRPSLHSIKADSEDLSYDLENFVSYLKELI